MVNGFRMGPYRAREMTGQGTWTVTRGVRGGDRIPLHVVSPVLDCETRGELGMQVRIGCRYQLGGAIWAHQKQIALGGA